MIKKYNISKPEKYMSNGVEKTFWANVGTMTEFEKQDGSTSRIVEIPAIGLKANVFLQEYKEPTTQKSQIKKEVKEMPVVDYPEDEINPEDIPF